VLILHAAALWALQSGLLMRAVEMVVPVQVMSDFIELPKPKQDAPPPPKPQVKTAATPVRQDAVRAAAPVPLAIADATPTPQAPMGVVTQQAVLPPISAPVAVSAVAAPVPKVELPSSDAEYLHNPKPEYPRLSKQRGEQGKVVVNVFIGADGNAQKAEIRSSSGFERLDQAALATARAWRYVPGKRGGVPEAMWFSVPINFVLE
jgi:protein TonB